MKITRTATPFPTYVSISDYYSPNTSNNSTFNDSYGFRQSKNTSPNWHEKGTNFLHLFTTTNIYAARMNYVCLEECKLDATTNYIQFLCADDTLKERFGKATTFISTATLITADPCYIDWNTLRIYKVDISKKISVFKLDPNDKASIFGMEDGNESTNPK